MAAPRSIATATVSFGLVSIPVKLFSTTQSSEGISFRMLHEKCKTPLKQQYICPNDGEKVERDQVVKGYEYSKDQFVLFSAEEIQALEEEATKAIAIEEFIPISSVDPVFYDKAYYLGPDKGGERAYKLLSRALEQTGLGGLAKYAARGKQYVVLVRPLDGGLLMQQLRYAQEVRPFSEVPVGAGGDVKEAELNLALQLLKQSTAEEYEPEKYSDESVARFQEILQRKIEGEQTVIVKGEPAPAKVIDLMEALKASLARSGESGAPARAAKGARSRGARGGPAEEDAEDEAEEEPAKSSSTGRRPPKAAAKPARAAAGGERKRSRATS